MCSSMPKKDVKLPVEVHTRLKIVAATRKTTLPGAIEQMIQETNKEVEK